MDLATAATMCRVNERMYMQTIPFVMGHMDFRAFVKTIKIMPIESGNVSVYLMTPSNHSARALMS